MIETWSENLRYEYPLNKDSIVFDIGGFDGTWANGIYSKYQCNVFVFEPVKEFYDSIKDKFSGNDKIHVHNYGLGTKDEVVNVEVIGMSTSILNKGENNEQVQIKDILPKIKVFDKIDLVKINIEGAEYDLLDHIIEKGVQTKLVNIQIQFHENVAEYEKRRQRIRGSLSKTHHLTFDFPIGLHENWKLND